MSERLLLPQPHVFRHGAEIQFELVQAAKTGQKVPVDNTHSRIQIAVQPQKSRKTQRLKTQKNQPEAP